MKIALVCKYFIESKGGLERYTVNLSRALRERGHDVHLFSCRWEPEQGLTFHRVPMIRFSSPAKNLSFAVLAGKAVQNGGFDVIQSMDRIWHQDIFRASDGINPVQMQERYSHPLVRKWKAAGPRRLALTWLENRIFRNGGCRYVMTNSRLIKEQIVHHYQVPPDRIRVIYNSVDLERFHPAVRQMYRESVRGKYGIGKNNLLLLFIGNDFKRKGLPLLIDAISRLQSPQIQLIVAGSDDPKPYLRQALRNGTGRQVHFTGAQKDVIPLYAAADVCVLPTRYDAFANVCLEAMACGVPVITTRSNGASELVESGKNGYVLKTWETEELAARIRDTEDPDQRIVLGENAARKARSFTGDQYMEQLFDLYEAVRSAKARS